MKKIINKAEDFVDEMIDGILRAHPDHLRCVEGDKRCLVTAQKRTNKVGIVTGGGSGHLPLFLGYIGEGMLDGCAVGGVFQSPSASQILSVTKSIGCEAGVLYLYGNYSGDVMNFDMASEMAEMQGMQTVTVTGNDDVASSSSDRKETRRGVAGIFFLYKAAGAAAALGMNLNDVTRIAIKAKESTRTIGVALSPCIVPELGRPSFTLGDNEMEIGMGIHGEPGIRRSSLKCADDIVQEMLDPVIADLPFEKNDEVAVLVNGLGATSKEELYIIYRKVSMILSGKGIKVYHTYVGEFATSMEMAGASVSLCRVDDELRRCLAYPVNSPFFSQKQM